jgi:hypothetical protein
MMISVSAKRIFRGPEKMCSASHYYYYQFMSWVITRGDR